MIKHIITIKVPMIYTVVLGKYSNSNVSWNSDSATEALPLGGLNTTPIFMGSISQFHIIVRTNHPYLSKRDLGYPHPVKGHPKKRVLCLWLQFYNYTVLLVYSKVHVSQLLSWWKDEINKVCSFGALCIFPWTPTKETENWSVRAFVKSFEMF